MWVFLEHSLQFTGKITVKETRVESLITQSDPLFIDQTAARTAAHSFSLSQSVSHLTVCAQSNSPWNQWLPAIINVLRWAWCLCPSLIVLWVCLGCKFSLIKVLFNFIKRRKLIRFSSRSNWIHKHFLHSLSPERTIMHFFYNIIINNLYYDEKRLNYLNSWISWQALKRIWQWVIRLYLEMQAWSKGDKKEGMKRQMGKQKLKKTARVTFQAVGFFFCVWFSERAALTVNPPDFLKRHRAHLSSPLHPQPFMFASGFTEKRAGNIFSPCGVRFTSAWVNFCHPLVFVSVAIKPISGFR